MAFCDFCPCEDCRTGKGFSTYHAQADDGRWICDVCYPYDVCGMVRRAWGAKYGGAPCEDLNCEHRPKLVTGWVTYSFS